ncbi:MAG: RNA-binding protein [Planctomycetaceae bacterium]|nr:RNA-binding protein [Planctomycetaceae bacterium]
MPQIFVGNLPFDASEAELRRRFECYGRVSSVRMVADAATSRPRGFAFVNMPSMDDADEAVTRLAGSSMGGRLLTINESRSSPSPSTASSDGDRKSTRDSILQMFETLRGE